MAAVLAVLAAVAGCGAVVVGYVDRAVLDSGQFANRATASLGDPAVRDFLGARIAQEAVRREPDLVGIAPLIRGASASVADSAPFRSIFRSAVRDVHRTVFEGDRDTILVTLSDIGVVVRSALAKLDPGTATKVDAALGATVVDEQLSGGLADDARRLADADLLALVLLAAALLLAAGALLVAGAARRRVTVWLGGGLVAGAVISLIALRVIRGIVMGDIGDPQSRAAAQGLWSAVLGDLRTVLLLTGFAGAVLAAAAASLIRPVELDEPLRRGWAWLVGTPSSDRHRALRAVLLLAAGVALVVDAGAALELAALILGALLIIGAVSEVLRLTAAPIAAAQTGAPHAAPLARVARAIPLRVIAAGLVAFAALALVTGLVTRDGGIATPDAPPIERCNGHAALCDRTLDEVAFAATHNSMGAASDPNFLFAQQEQGIATQLSDGIHGLLIDTHYGFPVNGRVLTDLQLDAASRAKFEREIGKDALDAALRIRGRLVTGKPGARGIYLCHALCELGAEPLPRTLSELNRFLTTHPHEVVIVVVQDATTPQDFVEAVRKAGLESAVYDGPIVPPWPTLRSMIADGRRLVILAEEQDGGAPWLRKAFAAMQETPYHFGSVAALTDPGRLKASCAPNRGEPGATLFQINHWVDTTPAPRPSNAKIVNAHGALLTRVRACERQRDLFPTLVAVDFYRQGDLFGVVDELNRVGGSAPAAR